LLGSLASAIQFFSWMVAVILLFTSGINGQTDSTGALIGIIVDPTGAVLGVSISLNRRHQTMPAISSFLLAPWITLVS